MNPRMYYLVSGVIFGLVAILHALRLAFGWEAVIGGWMMPVWVSGVGLVIAGYLAFSAFKLKGQS